MMTTATRKWTIITRHSGGCCDETGAPLKPEDSDRCGARSPGRRVQIPKVTGQRHQGGQHGGHERVK